MAETMTKHAKVVALVQRFKGLHKKYEGFEAVEHSAAASGAHDPAAVAAAAGRKKYGKEAFQHAAATGHKMGKSADYTSQNTAAELPNPQTADKPVSTIHWEVPKPHELGPVDPEMEKKLNKAQKRAAKHMELAKSVDKEKHKDVYDYHMAKSSKITAKMAAWKTPQPKTADTAGKTLPANVTATHPMGDWQSQLEERLNKAEKHENMASSLDPQKYGAAHKYHMKKAEKHLRKAESRLGAGHKSWPVPGLVPPSGDKGTLPSKPAAANPHNMGKATPAPATPPPGPRQPPMQPKLPTAKKPKPEVPMQMSEGMDKHVPGVSDEKYDSCVKQVKAKGTGNPYAICTASLKKMKAGMRAPLAKDDPQVGSGGPSMVGQGSAGLDPVAGKKISDSFKAFSDARLKKNIQPSYAGLKEVMALSVKQFNYKWDDRNVVGLIAQQVQEVFPQAVKVCETSKPVEGLTESLYIDYAQIVPVLINAIQEQQAQIEALKKGR